MNHTPKAVALFVTLAAASLALAQPEKKSDKPDHKPETKQPETKQPETKPDTKQDPKAPAHKDAGKPEQKDDKGQKPDEKKLTMKLTSSTIVNDTQMPKKHTTDGDPGDKKIKDVSPNLKWSGAPEGTKEFAVVMFDPDARGFVHWLIYNIPATTTELPEGIPAGKGNETLTKPITATQGASSFRQIGYLGPAARPGGGVHHYRFHVYALDKKLELKPGADRKQLDAAMQGHILAEGELIGNNER